jgi:hypothetical protein
MESMVGTVSPEPCSLSKPNEPPTLVCVLSLSTPLLLSWVVSQK